MGGMGLACRVSGLGVGGRCLRSFKVVFVFFKGSYLKLLL